MTIHSRAHLLAENVDYAGKVTKEETIFMKAMLDAPKFVIQHDAFELMRKADCGSALAAMIESNLARLPFKHVAVEWCEYNSIARNVLPPEDAKLFKPEIDLDTPEPVHEIVLLSEVEKDGKVTIVATYFFLHVRTKIGGMMLDHAAITFKPDGVSFAYSASMPPNQVELVKHATMVAVNAALVLVNMKGIDAEDHPEPRALNAARAKKSKPKISGYSYIKIGRVYRADGSSVKYREGDHRTMPMHVRMAHTRRQHYGTKNELVKTIFVPSVIVNFDPGGKLKPRETIVKA